MKKYLIIILGLNLIAFNCGKPQSSKVNSKKKIIGHDVIRERKKIKLPQKKVEINKNVYIVQNGDTVWSISEKVVRQRKGDNYTCKDIGNMFYKINRLNFKDNPGGVNDNLKIGDKILIP